MKKSYLSLLGFTLFFLGIIGLILSLVGLKLSAISFLDEMGRTFGLVTKLLLMVIGMILLYVSKTGSSVD